MQLTRFTDLGLRAMMLLAAGEAVEQRVTTGSIAAGANASENHIAKAVSRLVDLGMVHARAPSPVGCGSVSTSWWGQLSNASLEVWYEDGMTAGAPGAHPGLLTLDGVDLAEDAHIYLCGNSGFVKAVRSQLVDRGVLIERVHCELFSPNDWLLG